MHYSESLNCICSYYYLWHTLFNCSSALQLELENVVKFLGSILNRFLYSPPLSTALQFLPLKVDIFQHHPRPPLTVNLAT